MKLGFYGATGTVTGSKYLVETQGARVLIDCGLFQGYKQLRLRNWAPMPFDPASLDAVMLTHAHVDHSGYLPLLIKNGFSGPVYCTSATADLCAIMLPDSGRLHEEDAERANRKGYSKHKPALPLYTEADARRALDSLCPCDFGQDVQVGPGLTARFAPAGHILGSATLRLSDGHTSLGFTGDLGRAHDLIMRPPAAMSEVDWLVVESTYGDRRHESADPLAELAEVLNRTAARGGTTIVPAFAVGRTQALLQAIALLKADGRIADQIPVYLNSPMAIDVTLLYQRHHEEHRLDPAGCERMCRTARFVRSVDESMALEDNKMPKIIIAGSGMATGGRVVHHLKTHLPDPRHTILFSGYQAGGTRGAKLLDGVESLRMFGEDIPVQAEIVALSNLSAHADYVEMLDWLRTLPRPPRGLFVTHGEPTAADALRSRIQHQLSWHAEVPEYRDQVVLGESRP